MKIANIRSRARIFSAVIWAVLGFAPCPDNQVSRAEPAKAEPLVDREALAFIHDLLAQRPAREMTVQGLFKVRQGDGNRNDIPVRYSVQLAETNWKSIYQTARTGRLGPEELIVVHETNRPSRYVLSQVSLDGSRTNVQTLAGSEASLSLANTDFWLSDLGLEFLHWPQQRLVRDAKITMRFGRPCKVIESLNPRPTASDYSRVVTWIDSEMGSVIRAEAFDVKGKRFKFFSLKSFKKVDGRWQVKDIEIQNDHTDTRTVLEFQFDAP